MQAGVLASAIGQALSVGQVLLVKAHEAVPFGQAWAVVCWQAFLQGSLHAFLQVEVFLHVEAHWQSSHLQGSHSQLLALAGQAQSSQLFSAQAVMGQPSLQGAANTVTASKVASRVVKTVFKYGMK